MTLFAFRGAKSHEWTFCDPFIVQGHICTAHVYLQGKGVSCTKKLLKKGAVEGPASVPGPMKRRNGEGAKRGKG